jgi:hypothetical protein
MLRRTWLIVLALLWAAPAQAQQQSWPDTVFPESAHNFGTVARGSKLKHSFRLVNTTSAEIHIVNWSTKCGCTDVKVGAHTIPPGAQTYVEATLDTTKFLGQKNSGLTIFFDRPAFAQKDLNLSCFIRGDVLLNPGVVDFGSVTRGTTSPQVLQLTYMGGQPNWGITSIDTISSHISAKAEEIAGTRNGGQVQYRITVTLDSAAPTGYFKDQVTLHTNDEGAPAIPVSVTANVQGAVVVTPAVLTLGPLKPGQVVTKDILVRSSQPFTITGAVSKQGDVSATSGQPTPSKLHKLTVTVKAPSQPGPTYSLMELQTSLKDEPPVKFTAFATVLPQ